MRILLLLGPSSVGKSTLCEELRSTHKFHIISQDDIVEKALPRYKINLRKSLSENDIFKQLQSFMTEKEAMRLFEEGKLIISSRPNDTQKNGNIVEHQFYDFSFPSLDKVLKNAGFIDKDYDILFNTIKKASDIIQELIKTFDLHKLVLEEAFQEHKDPNKTIILDMVPGQDVNTLLILFEQYILEYRKKHSDSILETFTALAYSPPKELSERIIKRNKAADIKGNQSNKRVGLFPFEQLSYLSQPSRQELPLFESTKNDLFKISHHHKLTISKEHKEAKLKKYAQTALEYVKLLKKFGLKRLNTEKVGFKLRDGLKFDILINMTNDNPTIKQLAEKIVNEMKQTTEKRNLRNI